MPNTTTYKAKGKVYEIPEDKKENFLKSFPDAMEVKSFTIGKDTFDIPLEKVDAFTQAKPDAKPLKKKDGGKGLDSQDQESTSTSPGEGQLVEMANAGIITPPEPLTREQESELLRGKEPTKPLEPTYPEEFVQKQEEMMKWAKETQPERDKYIAEQEKLLAEKTIARIDQLSADLQDKLDVHREIYRDANWKFQAALRDEQSYHENMKDDPNYTETLKQKSTLTKDLYDQREELIKQRKYLDDVNELLVKAKKFNKTKDKGVLYSMFNSQYAADYFTLGANELRRNVDIYKAAKKPEGERSEEENMALMAYALNNQLRSVSDQKVSSMIGSGIAETIPYMIEFAISGGSATAAKEGIKKVVKELGEAQTKKLLSAAITKLAPVAGEAAGIGVRAMMLPSQYLPMVPERMTGGMELKDGKIKVGEGESFTEALTKTAATTYLSAGVETLGGPISKLTAKGKTKFLTSTIPGKKITKVADYVSKKIPSIPGANTAAARIGQQTFDAAGIQNFSSEVIEELIEAYGQPAITGDQKLSEVWDNKQMLAMVGTVAMISGSRMGTDMAFRGAFGERNQLKVDLANATNKLQPTTVSDIDNILKGEDMKKNGQQMDLYVKEKLNEGATRTDLKNMFDYYFLRTTMDNVDNSISIIESPLDEKEAKELSDTRAQMQENGEELMDENIPPKTASETPQAEPIVEPKTQTNEEVLQEQKPQEAVQEETQVKEEDVLIDTETPEFKELQKQVAERDKQVTEAKTETLPGTTIPRKVKRSGDISGHSTHVAISESNAILQGALEMEPESIQELTFKETAQIADVSDPEIVASLKAEALKKAWFKKDKQAIKDWTPDSEFSSDVDYNRKIQEAAVRLGYDGMTQYDITDVNKPTAVNVWNLEAFEGITPTHDEIVDRVAERSTDLQEIYNLFSSEGNVYDSFTPWQQDLIDNYRFSEESIENVTGFKKSEGQIPGWYSDPKAKFKPRSLEEVASNLMDDWQGKGVGTITNQDVMDFLETYPHPENIQEYTPNQSKLAGRYYELMGKKFGISSHGGRTMREQNKLKNDFNNFVDEFVGPFAEFEAMETALEEQKSNLTRKQYQDFKTIIEDARKSAEQYEEAFESEGPTASKVELRGKDRIRNVEAPTKKPKEKVRTTVEKEKPKTKSYAKETGTSAKETSQEERIVEKESQRLHLRNTAKNRVEAQKTKIDRKSIATRAKESIKRIGDITKKKPTDLVKESQSIEELDYIYEQYGKDIPFQEYNKKKNKLREKEHLDDETGRTLDIQDQLLEEKAKLVDQQLKEDLGEGKYKELKSKRAESIDKINDSLARLANVKYAVGDGKKLDTGRELVNLVKEMAKVGLIDVQLGTAAMISKLKTYFGKYLPDKVQLVDQYENLLARELGTREADKKLKEANVDSITENIKDRMDQRQKTEEKVNQSRKKSTKEWIQRMTVDESEPFKVELIKADSKLGQRAVDYFNLQAGVSGRDMVEFETSRKKILGGFKDLLNENEQRALEEYLQYKRVIELDTLYDARGENRLDHEGGLTKEEAEIALQALMDNNTEILQAHGINENIDWKKIDQRAKAYWDLMQEKLSDLRNEGLISEDVYKKLSTEQPYYSPRRYLSHFIGNVDPGGSISGIEALSGGSMGSILADTQTLMADVISRTNKSIARNKTMNALSDVANEVENDVVKPARYKQTKTVNGKEELGYLDKLAKEEQRIEDLKEKLANEGKTPKEIEEYVAAEQRYIEPTFEQAPNGYTTYKFKKDGVTNAIYLNDRYMEDFEQKPDSESMRKVQNILSWVSGNKILKAFATGYNPEFAIKNLPLDMLHIISTTEAYSPVIPVATAQLAKDIAKVSKDAFGKKGRYLEYVKEGGSMEFLSTQGSLSPRKFKAYNKMTLGGKALMEGAAYLGNSSELLTRLALRERMIENYTTEFKKENNRDPNPSEIKTIKERATAYTRNYLDFSQGGKAIKFMNSIVPYLNAGFQVTRGSLRAAKRNPKVFWFKMGQLGSTAAVIAAWNLGLTPWGDDDEKEERKQYFLYDISDRRKADNFILMTPLSYTKGDKKHYVYFAFPKDNLQKLMTGIIEGSVAQSIGLEGKLLNERRWMEFTSMTQNVSDIGNLPPLQRAIIGSSMNKDLYYKTDLWSGKDFGEDRFQEYTPELTPERYIKAAEWSREVSEALGLEKSLSPVRMQYFVSQFTTKSNVLSTTIGEAFDATIVGLDKETQNAINKSMAETLVTAPFTRRFFKKTSPYVQVNNAEKEQQKVNVEQAINDNKLKPFLKKDDIVGAVNVVLDQTDPLEAQRLMRKILVDAKLTGMDYRTRAMMFIPSGKARARVWYKYYSEADAKGKQKLIMESVQSKVILSGDDFKFELSQLMANDRKLKKDFDSIFE